MDGQRRLNPIMKDVVKKEIIKWLDAGIIYPISDSSWVSMVQCMPKKRGITVIENENNELILTRIVTGWRICIDYRKLNKATRKDHFPWLFLDQMLDRLAGRDYYYFLDGYSGYNQIIVAPKNQHKITFTYPYGTLKLRRMPFGLCNAPATFQRCMMSIFTNMVEKYLEVFMDDFLVFGDTYDDCLGNLAKDATFKFDEECLKAFKDLKIRLVTTPIIVTPDWDFPFELMCDVSNFAIRAVMGQRRNKVFHPIYYASRTLTGAQLNYTETFLDEHILKMIRRCVAEDEVQKILYHCHSALSGGHFGGTRTAAKVLQVRFFWPTLFKDTNAYVKSCDRCQRVENVTNRNEMPRTNIIKVELFDVWGIDFLGPFPLSFGHKYILVAVDYVSKWVEAEAYLTNNVRVVIKFLQKHVFTRFGTPSVIISDEGSHFMNKWLKWLLDKHGLQHKLEHKAYWALRQLNLDPKLAKEKRILQLNKLEELRILKFFPGKLKSRWSGPFTIRQVYPYGVVELQEILEELTVPGSKWTMSKQGIHTCRRESLTPLAKTIDVGKIILREIRNCAVKRSGPAHFPFKITILCLKAEILANVRKTGYSQGTITDWDLYRVARYSVLQKQVEASEEQEDPDEKKIPRCNHLKSLIR
ncbi:hypothetical protein CXB51_034623 [Gossypium anomalum]|uniref:Integrase catalytic domain-containing protein n=1 Tax=Gossypium anomalum TaxID=47600 RepID=A0A8J5Y1U4_9ROSI|nr:hypothetical protein CXB51_034623 [Gossypium anomalum]